MSEPGRPKCPVCGRLFWCDYPNQWAYKRGTLFLCSWGCLRKYDKGKEADGMQGKAILTDKQKRKAIEMALNGESPLPYLKECGAANPTTTWQSVLNWAKKNCDRDVYEELPERFGQQKKDTVPPWKPGTPKPPEEPEKEWTPAEEVYPKEEPKIELVYDESIADEYRREQEAKKAEDPLAYEIPIRKERVNIGPARLPIASVWSRAMEMGTFTKVQGIGMMLKDPECQILMSRAKWEELADEIRVALEMLEV